MSVHIIKCKHKGVVEWHLRYPGMQEYHAQALADQINAGLLKAAPSSRITNLEKVPAMKYKVVRNDDRMEEDVRPQSEINEWWEVSEIETQQVIATCEDGFDAIAIRDLLENQHDPKKGAVYGIIDPDYGRVFTMARLMAWNYGYSCCMQGSFTRDLDLLLVPWTETTRNDDLERVVKMLAEAAGLRILGEASKKPQGRLTWTLVFPTPGDPRFVDVTGFPSQKSQGLLTDKQKVALTKASRLNELYYDPEEPALEIKNNVIEIAALAAEALKDAL